MAVNIVLGVAVAAALGWAVWRAAKRVQKGGGCCGEREAAPEQVRAADRNKAHYPYSARMKIGGMTCENCARKVENALNGLDGVWASVKISDATAQIRCKNIPDLPALRRAVREAGYVAMEVEEG